MEILLTIIVVFLLYTYVAPYIQKFARERNAPSPETEAEPEESQPAAPSPALVQLDTDQTIAGDQKRSLDLALEGARIERLTFRQEEEMLEVLFDFSAKQGPAEENRETSLLFRFRAVSRLAVSHRREHWDSDGETEFLNYEADRLSQEVERFQRSELRGWDYFNHDETAFDYWKKYLTLDYRHPNRNEYVNTVDLFLFRYDYFDEILDFRIWFDDLEILNGQGEPVPTGEFAENFREELPGIQLVEQNGVPGFEEVGQEESPEEERLITDQLKIREKTIVADLQVFRTEKIVDRYGRRWRQYRGKIKRNGRFPSGLLQAVKRHYLQDRGNGSGENGLQPHLESFDLTLHNGRRRIFAVHILQNGYVELYLDADRSNKKLNTDYYFDRRVLVQTGRFWPRRDVNIVTGSLLERVAGEVRSYLRSDPPRSVLVTGDEGVGKSTFVQLVVRELMTDGWEVFEASGSDLIAGQQYIGQIEGRIKEVSEALSRADKILWYIPDFDKLQHQGKYSGHPISILDQLLPLMERKDFRFIGECRADQFEKVFTRAPKLKTVVEVVRMEALEDPEDVIPLALAWMKKEEPAVLWEDMGREQLLEISMLANQYLSHKKEPGRLLDFLKLCGMHVATLSELRPITFQDCIETLSTLTGLPAEMLDDRERLNVEELEDYFRSKIIGQEEAVKVIVERIAMIKAGLTDSEKPSGVFLFVGPTGTGKTEIAKALATFLFGSEQRLIRLDMSEFQTWDSLSRLTGEDNKLFNQIRKHPFSVVLLDEFEKAHANIWDLFLQVFDDGRLTDDKGETADFRHAIIIMTSNLGAQAAQIPSIGFGRESRVGTNGSFMKTLLQTFRPEFINRIDRIVRFNALSRTTLRQILLNELSRVLQRRGFRQRQWAVEWEDSALDFLLQKGYSAQLGARPLKRAIEEYLLGPLAMTIVNNRFPQGDQFLFVRSDGQELTVDFVDPDESDESRRIEAPGEEKRETKTSSLSVRQLVLDSKGDPAERDVLLEAFDRFMDFYETKGLLERKETLLAATYEPAFWEREDRRPILHEIELLDRIQAATETTASLLERLEGEEKELHFPPELIGRTAQRVYLLDQAVRAYASEEEQDAFLRLRLSAEQATHPENLDFLQKLAGMYEAWARKRKMKWRLLRSAPDQMDYAFSGFGAWYILRQENGIHLWELQSVGKKKERLRTYVEVVPQNGLYEEEEWRPIADRLFREHEQARKRVVRAYRSAPSPLVKDNPRGWRTGLLQRVLEGDFDLFESS
jgi:ATP-dependent Clp protease ATP-binding subunit ClpC